MDGHLSYSVEERLMILCLIVSSALISISAHVELRPIIGFEATADDAAKAATGHALAPAVNEAARRTGPVNSPPANPDAMLRADEASSIGNDAISIAKDLHIGRARAGRLDVTVTVSGELMVDYRQLKELMAAAGVEQRGDAMEELRDGPADLRALQRAGIDIRYSPEEDVFRING